MADNDNFIEHSLTEVSVKGRGFASMDPEKQKEIASKGGKASHRSGNAHEWNSREAQEAGRKGGRSSNREE